jgi:hypothetical protein
MMITTQSPKGRGDGEGDISWLSQKKDAYISQKFLDKKPNL